LPRAISRGDGKISEFRRIFDDPAAGTRFATGTGMSPISRALHERFEEVCRAELIRLRRKTAALSPEDRAEIDAITVAVTHAIASRVEAALECEQGEAIAGVVARLFDVAPDLPPAGTGGAR
jgi:hypothetical protein